MRKLIPVILVLLCAFTLSRTADKEVVGPAQKPAPAPAATMPHFGFTDPAGQQSSAPLVEETAKRRLNKPFKQFDPRFDPTLTKAATIAQERAHARSKSRCWRYVKQALLAAGAVTSYPKTEFAKEAGDELVRDFGFEKLPINDPYAAPVGSVIVYYKGEKLPGHVEIRTKEGFVSDFKTKNPSPHPVLGVYAKSS